MKTEQSPTIEPIKSKIEDEKVYEFTDYRRQKMKYKKGDDIFIEGSRHIFGGITKEGEIALEDVADGKIGIGRPGVLIVTKTEREYDDYRKQGNKKIEKESSDQSKIKKEEILESEFHDEYLQIMGVYQENNAREPMLQKLLTKIDNQEGELSDEDNELKAKILRKLDDIKIENERVSDDEVVEEKDNDGIIELTDEIIEPQEEKNIDTETQEISEEDSELKKIAEEEKERIEKMKPKDKKTFLEGIANFGYRIAEVKNNFLADKSNYLSGKFKSHKFVSTFFNKFANTYEKSAKRAKEQREIVGKGKISRLSGVGRGAGTVMRYGRIILDIGGNNLMRGIEGFNPFRHATAGAMVLGRGAEAVKETRLEYDSAKEKIRVKDQNRAFDEAWDIYDNAKKNSKNGKVEATDLEKEYKEKLPEDLLKRLDRAGLEGTAWCKYLFEKDAKGKVERIINKIEKIENNKNLSKKEKEIKKQIIIKRNEELISDLDKMVGDQGVVDKISYWSRIAEKTSKGVAAALMIDTAYRLAHAACDMTNLLDKWSGTEAEMDEQPEVKRFKISEQAKSPTEFVVEQSQEIKSTKPSYDPSGKTDPFNTEFKQSLETASKQAGAAVAEVTTAEQAEATQLPEYIVQKNDNLWKIIGEMDEIKDLEGGKKSNAIANVIKAIKNDPEKFKALGFENAEDIHNLEVGQKIDLNEIKKILNTETIGENKESIIEHATKGLSDEQIKIIEANDKLIAEFHEARPEILLNEKTTEWIIKNPEADLDQVVYDKESGEIAIEEVDTAAPMETVAAVEEPREVSKEPIAEFKKIVGDAKLTTKQAEKFGIDFSNGISEDEKIQLKFLVKHQELINNPKEVRHIFQLSEGAEVSFNKFGFLDAYHNMPDDIKFYKDQTKAEGFLQIFAGTKMQVGEGLKKLGISGETWAMDTSGTVIVEDAFGENGVKVLLTEQQEVIAYKKRWYGGFKTIFKSKLSLDNLAEMEAKITGLL